jgi:hypothetical protein
MQKQTIMQANFLLVNCRPIAGGYLFKSTDIPGGGISPVKFLPGMNEGLCLIDSETGGSNRYQVVWD